MERVAAKLGLKLAWTGSLNEMKKCNPLALASAPCGGASVAWEYSLGQAYTEGNTQDLYATGGCAPSPTFYGSLGALATPPNSSVFWQTHMVPMLCGSGDCQETPPNYYVAGGACTDERLGPSQLEAVLSQSLPSDYTLRNFAVWYGTLPLKTGEASCFCSKATGSPIYLDCHLDANPTWEQGCTSCDPVTGASCMPYGPATDPACSANAGDIKCYAP
mmetsp:Transcript_18681/g.47701  ORF Transcript_18681/g.47701 Transcript_18681/m.47701 type:complete len:218 (-) Transcript_18681:94-747(-)